ncbi:MAG: tryptophan 2,3-dioxygenase family protein, partial [Marinirhabdus sp.]
WDYIHLDTLLSLQIPRTHFPDEEIFIAYHQITELYFKLVIHEMKQIVDDQLQQADFFTKKLQRINRYFRIMINSFDVMIKGMDREQFLKYRMALLPASGFQSAQFRIIEIYATPLEHLAHASMRDTIPPGESIEDLFEKLYWKQGATDLATKEKTLTLKQFEYRYTPRLIRIANQVKNSTLYHTYLNLPEAEKDNARLITAMRTLDENANINWPLMHMGAAHRHLNTRKNSGIAATGGTNWKEFLPPSFQKVHFFPNLWKPEEKEAWGRQWVHHTFNTEKNR